MKEYTSDFQSNQALERITTNDLYFAAFLLCKGCRLDKVQRNSRNRVSFIIAGINARELREEYRSESVTLNPSSFRDRLIEIRKSMDTTRGAINAQYRKQKIKNPAR